MALQAEHLHFTYSADTPWAVSAVNDVSFSIDDGEVVGLVGHTGSGKSSLAQLVCGLLQADSGSILLGDLQLVAKKRPKAVELARRVGMVFQYPEYQLFEETVAAEIAYGPGNLGWTEEMVRQRVQRIAARLKMSDSFLARNPMQLSGGEKRKVALASVLVMEPTLLVLDEPFVGLDSVAKNDFTELLLQWQQDNNASILCISHDMDQLALFCRRLLVMDHGSLVLDAPIEQAFDRQEVLKKAGILQPVPKELLLLLHRQDSTVDKMPITIPGASQAIIQWLAAKGGNKGGQ